VRGDVWAFKAHGFLTEFRRAAYLPHPDMKIKFNLARRSARCSICRL
jgi:hypothetical protein